MPKNKRENPAALSHDTATNQPILLSAKTAENLKIFVEFYAVQCYNKNEFINWFLRLLEETTFSNNSSLDNLQTSEVASCIRQINNLVNSLNLLVPQLMNDNNFFYIPPQD